MEEDFSLDLQELNEFPTFGSEEASLNQSDESEEPVNKNYGNIERINEYLDKDIEDQILIIDKLKEFEMKLDEYINDSS